MWKRIPFAAGVLLIVLLLAWLWWLRSRQSATRREDPRLTPVAAYRNLQPEVKYVGGDACAECHADKMETYRQHPMGRSTALVSQATHVERYDAAAHNPFEQLDFQL